MPGAVLPFRPSGSGEVEVLDPAREPDWNGQLSELEGAGAFHSSEWAELIREAYGFVPLYPAIRRRGAIASVLPLMEVDSRISGRRGVSLPFSDHCGVASLPELDAGPLHAMAGDLAARRRWRYLELRSPLPGTMTSAGKHYFSHRVRLGSEAEMWRRMKPATRRAIRRAQSMGLRIESRRDTESMSGFYELLCHTRRRLGVPPQSRRFFSILLSKVIQSGRGELFMAYHNGRPVAGGIYVHWGRQVIFKYGASDRHAQHLRPNNLITWQVMREFAERGFTEFHLGRNDRDNPGLRRYKLGWGATEEALNYERLRTPAGPGSRQLLSGEWLDDIRRSVFRRMPIPVACLVGRLAYPHVG